MEGEITENKLVSKSFTGDNYDTGISIFEDKIKKQIKLGWTPFGGPTRTAICRGRLTVQEHTITQAMVQYAESQTLDFLIDK
jgi:hypothetical protein